MTAQASGAEHEAVPLGTASLDQLSLEQALRDFEVANTRVIDLTRRVVELTETNIRLRHELESLRTEVDRARGSRAYRLVLEARKGLMLFRR